MDIAENGSIVVCGGYHVDVRAHETSTGTVLWKRNMPGTLWVLKIHRDMVFVFYKGRDATVLDLITGHRICTLPSIRNRVSGFCVYDGLMIRERQRKEGLLWKK